MSEIEWTWFRHDIQDDGSYAKWRAESTALAPRYMVCGESGGRDLADTPEMAAQRILVTEALLVDDIATEHEGQVTHVTVMDHPACLRGDECEYPLVTRRTSVMAGDVVLGSVVVRWTGEFRAEVVRE